MLSVFTNIVCFLYEIPYFEFKINFFLLLLQAVECILGGVKYSNSEEFHNFMLKVGKKIAVWGYRLNRQPDRTGGPLYRVKLLSKEGKSINRILFSEGIVEADDDSDTEAFFRDSEYSFSEEDEVGSIIRIRYFDTF